MVSKLARAFIRQVSEPVGKAHVVPKLPKRIKGDVEEVRVFFQGRPGGSSNGPRFDEY